MYAPELNPHVKLTVHQVQAYARDFAELKNLKDLSIALKMDPHKLKLLALNPPYEVFYLPKEDGSQRLIETPRYTLKTVQRRLAAYLQFVYYDRKPDAVYGFVISPRYEPEPRNLYTHAQQHLGAAWVYNLDFDDFFHQITFEQIHALFQQPPFAFTPQAVDLLAELCTYGGRLPMGAPTSPILSNWACLPLDRRLEKLAEPHGWTYTRYADDLSFSGKNTLSEAHQQEIQQAILDEGFALDPDKIRLYRPEDPPEVTGLLLKGEEIDVSDRFLHDLKGDLYLLTTLSDPRMLQRNWYSPRLIRQLRRSVEGQLEFMRFVRGQTDKEYRLLMAQLSATMKPEGR